MKKLSLLLAIICVLLYCSACFAGSQYKELYKDEYYTLYLNKNSVKVDRKEQAINNYTYSLYPKSERPGVGCICWLKKVYSNKGQQYYKTGKVKYTKMNYTFNSNKKYFIELYDYDVKDKLIKKREYDEISTKGNEVYYIKEQKSIKPGSIEEKIWNYLQEYIKANDI